MAFRGVPCCLPVLRCDTLSGSLCGCPGIPVSRVPAIRAGSRYELHCPLVCHGIPQLWESRPMVPVLCILVPAGLSNGMLQPRASLHPSHCHTTAGFALGACQAGNQCQRHLWCSWRLISTWQTLRGVAAVRPLGHSPFPGHGLSSRCEFRAAGWAAFGWLAIGV